MQAVINALVVDDSAYNRVTISRMLESHPDIRVVATAVNGEDAIKQVLKHRPDVITLDLEMPVMDGFAFLRWLMHDRPTPVIAVSSKASDRSVFKALELGAFDFIQKPGGRVSPRLEEIRKDLIAKVLQVAQLRMDNLQRSIVTGDALDGMKPMDASGCEGGIELIAIGCSTGGPPALQYLFQTLPLLPVPIVVAQHMPSNFTRLFAERVNRLSPYQVKEAVDGEAIERGFAYVAPGGMQTEIRRAAGGLQIAVLPSSAADLYAPSVDRLLQSASDTCADRLIAIIMTGMGDDGAAAIRRVRDRGARTIAESAETAIIFGMPKEAIRTGAIDQVLPLEQIPGAIHRLCQGSSGATQPS